MGPSVSQFTILGEGNGFAECLPKVDVSGYDAYNPMTLANACKLYWLAWGVSGICTATDSTRNVQVTEADLDTHHISGPTDYEPEDRLCDTDIVTAHNEEEDDPFSAYLVSLFYLHAKVPIVRMYNGSTASEGNFIGYGINYIEGPIIQAASGGEGPFTDTLYADIQLFSYCDIPFEDEFYELGNVTVSGIPFVARMQSYYGGVAFPGTNDFVNIQASASDSGWAVSAKIDSIEFYNPT